MANDETIAEVERPAIRAAIMRLLDECKTASGAQRAHKREPFFGPVTVVVGDGENQRQFSCFSRDISPTGIGLLHNMPLPFGVVALTIRREVSQDVRLRGEVMWCQSCGEGWYTSGIQFTAVGST